MKILYLVFESVKNPIVESQVIEMSEIISNKIEADFTIISLEKETITNLERENTTHLFVKHRNILISYLAFFMKIIGLFIKGERYDIIHVRSYLPMPIALFLKKIYKTKVIFDMRGLFPEEYLLLKEKNKQSIMYFIFKKIEKYSIKYSDDIIVVSKNFKNYITNNYKIDQEIELIYCSANRIGKSQVNQILATEMFKDNDVDVSKTPIIAYVGSLYKYQNFDKIISYLTDLSEQQKFIFVVFTKNNPIEIFEIADKYGLNKNRIYIKYVKSTELVDYLSYCDYGIIMRDDNIINKVSSPIKISEYIMNDMKIIHTGNIGDFDNLLEKFDCGINITKRELKLQKMPRNYENAEAIKKLVSYNYNSEKYLDVYKRIIEK